MYKTPVLGCIHDNHQHGRLGLVAVWSSVHCQHADALDLSSAMFAEFAKTDTSLCGKCIATI